VVEVKPQEIREKMKQVTLKIEGMTCNHCVVSVRRALLETKGVISAEVELKGGTALVSGDGFELESLKKAVETIGYKVVAK
jgi:copper chaperone CopZ